MSAVADAVPRPFVQRATYVRPILAVLAGLAIGAGASSIFAILLSVLTVRDHNPSFNPSEALLPPIVIALTFASGTAFASLVAFVRGEHTELWRTLLTGASFPAAALAGLVFVLALEPFASRSDLALPVFRVAFVAASGMIAFACTWAAASLFGVPRGLRMAIVTGLITAATYLLVALALDPLPGFHVGGGSRAMPKVAVTCNFLAGFVGAMVAFGRLTKRQ